MLIDYLRYQAFSGRLRSFFEEELNNYVNPEWSTGQHLRFAPDWMDSRWAFFAQELIEDTYGGGHFHTLGIERALDRLGIRRLPDPPLQPEFIIGERPPTYNYEDVGTPRLEIIIDIDPIHWSEKYSEPSSYEETPIIYRRREPARANLGAGDRLFDNSKGRGGYGTLCGLFQTDDEQIFGLTCAHVTRDGSELLVERRRRFWELGFGPAVSSFGSTRHYTVCGPEMKIGRATAQLDAALVECGRRIERSQSEALMGQAFLKPISSMIQETPVHFRGANRRRMTRARIAAVTVRKSIDLFNDGDLRSVGDVLMLDHPEPMYFVKPVSHPGDSGAAVRFGRSDSAPLELNNQWYGMVLGGDEHSAYASHAEFIWAWVAASLSTRNLKFYFN